jgi:hypothetical protein
MRNLVGWPQPIIWPLNGFGEDESDVEVGDELALEWESLSKPVHWTWRP